MRGFPSPFPLGRPTGFPPLPKNTHTPKKKHHAGTQPTKEKEEKKPMNDQMYQVVNVLVLTITLGTKI